MVKSRIILAGGSGFIGRSLTPLFLARDYEVVVLTRSPSTQRGGVRYVQWDGKTGGEWVQFINEAATVVNLTDRSINCRHTPQNRREIIESRVNSVRILARQPIPKPKRLLPHCMHTHGMGACPRFMR